jgi:prepilin-type N-terminal cleavage/methylation domain-containing protein
MKFELPFSRSCRGAARGGFTLPELLIASTIMTLVVAGILAAHLFGLKMFQLTEAKLNATAGARKTIGKLTDEIRRCNGFMIGNVTTNDDFVGLLDGERQQGGGLLIQATTNASDDVFYFVNPSDETFRRSTRAPGTTSILAEAVTNALVFQEQDYSGNVQTNRRSNHVLHMKLEFYQSPRPLQPANYYKLETSVTKRPTDSP